MSIYVESPSVLGHMFHACTTEQIRIGKITRRSALLEE